MRINYIIKALEDTSKPLISSADPERIVLGEMLLSLAYNLTQQAEDEYLDFPNDTQP